MMAIFVLGDGTSDTDTTFITRNISTSFVRPPKRCWMMTGALFTILKTGRGEGHVWKPLMLCATASKWDRFCCRERRTPHRIWYLTVAPLIDVIHQLAKTSLTAVTHQQRTHVAPPDSTNSIAEARGSDATHTNRSAPQVLLRLHTLMREAQVWQSSVYAELKGKCRTERAGSVPTAFPVGLAAEERTAVI